jgi:hypothetical protein
MARGITMTGCAAMSSASIFANDGSKSERCLTSTPTRGGDAFSKKLTRLNLASEGLLLGSEPPSLSEGLPQATPARWGSWFKAPPHISEDDRSYFSRSKGRQRSPSESPDGQTKRKLSESREWRSQAGGDTVMSNWRLLCQHQHVSPSHWSVEKWCLNVID